MPGIVTTNGGHHVDPADHQPSAASAAAARKILRAVQEQDDAEASKTIASATPDPIHPRYVSSIWRCALRRRSGTVISLLLANHKAGGRSRFISDLFKLESDDAELHRIIQDLVRHAISAGENRESAHLAATLRNAALKILRSQDDRGYDVVHAMCEEDIHHAPEYYQLLEQAKTLTDLVPKGRRNTDLHRYIRDLEPPGLSSDSCSSEPEMEACTEEEGEGEGEEEKDASYVPGITCTKSEKETCAEEGEGGGGEDAISDALDAREAVFTSDSQVVHL